MAEGTRAVRDRSAQKRRTRRAILAAAVELMRRGETPTARRVADLAEVSRRTVYLYFPTQEQLLTEAAMEGVRAEVERALAAMDDVRRIKSQLTNATTANDEARKILDAMAANVRANLATIERLLAGAGPDA